VDAVAYRNAHGYRDSYDHAHRGPYKHAHGGVHCNADPHSGAERDRCAA
jgi:hypothetical protein